MSPDKVSDLHEMLAEDGAYEVLWEVIDWLEYEWPQGATAKCAPEKVHERIGVAIRELKAATGLFLT